MSGEHADQGYRKLWATMAGMTWKERWEYFWEYYKWITIGVIVGVIVLGSFIYDLAKPEPEVIFSGAAVNVTLTEQAQKALTEELLTFLEGGEDQTVTLVTSTVVTDLSETHDAESNYAEAMRLVAQIAARELDYLLTDAGAKAYLLQQGVMRDLRELLSQTQLDQLADRLVYCETEDGQQIPVAIDLAGTVLAEGCTTKDGLYIAFVGNTGREDRIGQVLEYLLNRES